jgi:hypothetical protein
MRGGGCGLLQGIITICLEGLRISMRSVSQLAVSNSMSAVAFGRRATPTY